MKTILRNFLFTIRRFKLSSILNILGLSVAFAVFWVCFSQINYDKNYDRCYKNSDQIFQFYHHSSNLSMAIVSSPFAKAFMNSSPHIVAGFITSTSPDNVVIQSVNDPEGGIRANHLWASKDIYKVIDFDILEGQASSLETPGHILIPQSCARNLFGDESAVGKQVKPADAPSIVWTVGGVYKDYPKNNTFGNPVISIEDQSVFETGKWGNSSYRLFVRLDSPENADLVLENFKTNLALYVPAEAIENRGAGSFTEGAHLDMMSDMHFIKGVAYDYSDKADEWVLRIMLSIAIAILLIAGINYVNFSISLAPMRVKSINTQKVLGSNLSSLRWSLVFENVIICFFAYIISIILIFLISNSFLINLTDAELNLSAHAGLVLVLLGTALLMGLFTGLYPSLYITSFPPALVLKGNFILNPKGKIFRNLMIGTQYVISFVLIIVASFMFVQQRYILTSDVGYDRDNLIVVRLNNDLTGRRASLKDDLMTVTGVKSVTYSQVLLSTQDTYMGWGRNFRDKEINFQAIPVDIDFLEVLGVKITDGRYFREGDENTDDGALIFNECARTTFGLTIEDNVGNMPIIGFMSDVKYASFRQQVSPMAFILWGKSNANRWNLTPYNAYIQYEPGTNVALLIQNLNKVLDSYDSEYPFAIAPFGLYALQAYETEIKFTSQVSAFCLIAILLSIIGVFGLVMFESAYRRKEIGVRKVFGSTSGNILIMFNKIYLKILMICFVISIPIAWYIVNHWLESFAYRTPIHWWVFAVAFFIILVVTVVTVTFQDWRAANANPVESIKTE